MEVPEHAQAVIDRDDHDVLRRGERAAVVVRARARRPAAAVDPHQNRHGRRAPLAARRGGWVDGVVQFIAVVGFAVPGFLIALYLVLWFAIDLGWFRATGYVPIGESFTGWLSSVTLPIAALSLSAIAAVAQQVRGSVIDATSRDYVRTLRARGLSTNRVVYKHVLRNAGGPALAVLAVQFVGLLGGAVIVEQVFALPGIGQLTVSATSSGDIPVVMGVVVATAVAQHVDHCYTQLAMWALTHVPTISKTTLLRLLLLLLILLTILVVLIARRSRPARCPGRSSTRGSRPGSAPSRPRPACAGSAAHAMAATSPL